MYNSCPTTPRANKLKASDLLAKKAASFLLDLLINADIRGALHLYEAKDVKKLVHIIGNEQLSHRYALALKDFNFQSKVFDVEEIYLKTCRTIADNLGRVTQ